MLFYPTYIQVLKLSVHILLNDGRLFNLYIGIETIIFDDFNVVEEVYSTYIQILKHLEACREHDSYSTYTQVLKPYELQEFYGLLNYSTYIQVLKQKADDELIFALGKYYSTYIQVLKLLFCS